MRKNRYQKFLPAFTIMYLGVALIAFSIFLGSLGALYLSLGQLALIIGSMSFYYTKISKKIDEISISNTNMKNLGVDQIISTENGGYEALENLIKKSSRVDIIYNANKLTNRFHFLVSSLIEEYAKIEFRLLIVKGESASKSEDAYIIDKLFYLKHSKSRILENENVKVRITFNSIVDNLILFDEKVVCTHYDLYNKPFMFIILNEHNGYGNYRDYFNDMWSKSDLMRDWEG